MKTRPGLTVAALSISLIALELTWTRIFSAEFFYTFAFLILSLAVLGLGMGALAIHLLPALNRERNLGFYLAAAGLMTLAGPPLVFRLGLVMSQLFHSWAMVGRFVATTFLLNGAFFFGGMALALIFKQHHRELPRLYMADLLGAAAGVLLIFPAMNRLGTPVATFACALPVLLAALVSIPRWWKLLPAALVAGGIFLGAHAGGLLTRDREEPWETLYEHWDAMAKVRIIDRGPDHCGINIDNAANSPVYKFDGNWDRPDSLRFEFGLDVSYLVEEMEGCVFLSLGAGGGADVLQALQAGATEVHAVEVIPHINQLMTTGRLAEYSGNIYLDPRVKVVTEDARAYVRRHRNKFDFIYSLSSNSWAALASGAFALAENYLFTTEAFEDYWQALTDRGFMMMEHQYYMPRLASSLRDALTHLGVPDAESHYAIYDLPQMRRKMILLSRQPLTDEALGFGLGDSLSAYAEHIYLLHPPAEGHEDNLIRRIVTDGWRAQAAEAPVDISPGTDNRPFVGQMGLWKNFAFDKLERVSPLGEVMGFPLSKLMIVVILAVMIGLILPLNLLPALIPGEKLRLVPWLYFFAIGAAFMIVEVILIQKYALFIGPSVYSMATILLTLLLASGIGSRFARWVDYRIAFTAILGWLLLEVFVLPQITGALGHLTQVPRMLISALLVAPLGFFMGMPFPKGGLRVGKQIAWGLAVNGAASVLGSTGIILVAIVYGFTAALLVGAALYGAAFGLHAMRHAW